MRVVDLFAGPGGWDQGLADLGFDGTVVGLEWDTAACQTAVAAGHLRVQADVAQYPTDPFHGWEGVIASPPCQAFSLAGKGAGLSVVDKLLEHVWACKDGWVDPPSEICTDDVRADLTLQPLRWADAVRPEWMAFEQVPQVLPLWKAMASVFERWGYSTSVAILSSEEYGVPQTRRRAILVASRVGVATVPTPTHTAYDSRLPDGGRTPAPSLFGDELLPWVSMADGLGWPAGGRMRTGANSMKHSRDASEIVPYERSTDDPAPTVDAKAGGAWQAWGFTNRPAPTVIAGPNGKSTGAEWGGSSVREAMYAAQGTPEWAHKRPATTVVGSFCPDVIAAPGYRTEVSRQNAPDSIRVSVEEAGVLQSFPPDYPWQGSKTKRHEQVGNAIPPRLAAAVLAPLVAEHCAAAAA